MQVGIAEQLALGSVLNCGILRSLTLDTNKIQVYNDHGDGPMMASACLIFIFFFFLNAQEENKNVVIQIWLYNKGLDDVKSRMLHNSLILAWLPQASEFYSI